MKKKLSKEEFEDLPDILKEQYQESGGQYLLDLEDGDVDALKRAKDYEKEARKDAEKKLREATEELSNANSELAKLKNESIDNSGDIEAVKSHYQTQLDELKKANQTELESITGQLNSTLLESATNEILAGLNPIDSFKGVLKQAISQRLTIESKDGSSKVGVLDPNGTPSLAGISELKKEMIENTDFAPMFIGTQASGGGAAPGTKGGSTAPKEVDFTKDASATDLVASLESKIS